ncbi:MAG: IS3 family transposase [Oscillospiraceae bacterium]|nr:IS3 family transposase [Oscillospiraceae bacterium]
MRYAYIERQSKRWTVYELCKALGVSESGYYRYQRRKDRPSRSALLSAAMAEILAEHPQNENYGAPRMQQALAQRGMKAGLRRVKRIMREHGWLHERQRRPKGLTKADPEAMAAENLLKQDFHAEKPFKKLLTDITQVQCRDGKLYISPIMDCFNGEILSLELRDNMMKELCIDTVKATGKRFPVRGAILHSDRGSQYTSEAFRSELARQGLTQSLSGVAHCYDNARMESFFATLKKELIYRIPAYRLSKEKVKTLVFRYVFVYYNRIRVYTANPGGWPPETWRKMQYLAKAA